MPKGPLMYGCSYAGTAGTSPVRRFAARVAGGVALVALRYEQHRGAQGCTSGPMWRAQRGGVALVALRYELHRGAQGCTQTCYPTRTTFASKVTKFNQPR